MEEYKHFLKQAIKHLQLADHMTYVTLPIVNEKRLIIKIFEEIYKSIENSLNSAINYEFIKKNIILHKDHEKNISNFLENISKKYELNEKEIIKIKKIIEIEEKYEKSAIEFVKKEKVVIMLDNLDIQTLTVKEIKNYLLTARELLIKVGHKVR